MFFITQNPIEESQVISHVTQAFTQLYDELSAYTKCVDRLKWMQGALGTEDEEPEPHEHMQRLFQSLLFMEHNQKPYHNAVHSFYSQAFKVFDFTTKINAGRSIVDSPSIICGRS